MKWIKAINRLPEEGVHILSCKVITMPTTLVCSVKDGGGIFKDLEDTIYPMEVIQWLDETPEDWDLLEKQFNKDFNTLTDKPVIGYDVVQWIKEKLRATN